MYEKKKERSVGPLTVYWQRLMPKINVKDNWCKQWHFYKKKIQKLLLFKLKLLLLNVTDAKVNVKYKTNIFYNM